MVVVVVVAVVVGAVWNNLLYNDGPSSSSYAVIFDSHGGRWDSRQQNRPLFICRASVFGSVVMGRGERGSDAVACVS